MARVAYTRAVPATLERGEVTNIARTPIDLALARRQHEEYEAALTQCGYEVRRLPQTDDLPDSVFVEDTAVVFDEVAVITRPGAESRRPEVASAQAALGKVRQLRVIIAPATIDGGDVLVLGKKVYIGRTPRTNGAGIEQFRAAVRPFSYAVTSVPVKGCLHLKSGVTALDDKTLVINPDWIDPALFAEYRQIHVDPSEPGAANVVIAGDHVLASASAPRTAQRLRDAGYQVITVPTSEVAKVEGGLTCCSLLLSD